MEEQVQHCMKLLVRLLERARRSESMKRFISEVRDNAAVLT